MFGVLFDLCMIFGVQRILANLQQIIGGLPFAGFYGGGIAASSPSVLKLFIFGLVPFISMTASLALARTVFRGTGHFEGDVFTAGASLLPVGLFVLLACFLGFGNVEVIVVLALFALCYTILMLYTGCTRIAKVPDAGAAFAIPVILLASGWLSKIIFTSLLSSGYNPMQ